MRNLRTSAGGIALILALLASFVVITMFQPRVVEANPDNSPSTVGTSTFILL